MNASSLAARIRTLTHSIDALEVLQSHTPVNSLSSQGRDSDMAFEIAMLHALLDQLNLDYEEACDRELDCAFERA